MRSSTEVKTTNISFFRELEIFRLYDFSNNVWALRSMWTQLGIELCYQLPWTWIMIQLWDYGNPSIHQHVILPPDFRNIFTSPIFAHWWIWAQKVRKFYCWMHCLVWKPPNWLTKYVDSPQYPNTTSKGTPHVKKNVFFRATCTSFSAVIKEYIKCIF